MAASLAANRKPAKHFLLRRYAAGSDSKYRYFRQFASALPIIRMMCRDV
jgi:hypothetical protein